MDAFLEIFSAEGRVNRAWFIAHVLLDDFVIIGSILMLLLVGQLVSGWLVALPLVGVLLGGVWAAVAVTVKRLHDLDRPGWQVLLMAIPIVNIIVGLTLVFSRGTVGPNQYGADPLEAAQDRELLTG